MTKAEKATLDAALRELSMERAMRRSKPVKRDLPPPEKSEEVTHGWDFNSYNNGTTFKVTSSCTSHFDGDWIDRNKVGGWSQNRTRLYSTELKALQAMRYEMAEGFAAKLAAVDARIDEMESEK